MTRKELAVCIYNQMKENKLGRDNKLPSERELASLFNVTRSLIREALAVLEAFGVIEVKDRQGIFIKEKSWDEIMLPVSFLNDWPLDILPQMFEVRAIFEPRVAAIAARRRTESDINRLNQTLIEMEKLFKEDMPEKASLGERWNSVFHSLIVAATHNNILCRMYESVIHLYERSVTSFPKKNAPMPFEKWPKEIWVEHSSIVNAIEKGDEKEAEACAFKHVAITQERIYRFMKSLRLDSFTPFMSIIIDKSS